MNSYFFFFLIIFNILKANNVDNEIFKSSRAYELCEDLLEIDLKIKEAEQYFLNMRPSLKEEEENFKRVIKFDFHSLIPTVRNSNTTLIYIKNMIFIKSN